MDIVEQNQIKLIIRHRPLWIWLLGGILSMVGLVLILFAQASSLTCQRLSNKKGACQLLQSSLVKSQAVNITLNSLKSAILEPKSNYQDNSSYRISLLTSTGEIPLTSNYSSESEQINAIVYEINAFIRNPNQASLKVAQDDRWLNYLFGSVIMSVGCVVAVYKGQTVILSFDKVRDRMMLKQQGLLGGTTIQLPLTEIADVIIENTQDAKEHQLNQVALVLKSGKHLGITPSVDPFWNHKKLAHCIRVFLNIH